jgi:hypothetical protein
MSSTKLYGDSALKSLDGDDGEQSSAGDDQRRRYLMRYVVAVIGLSGTICVAAGVRMALARPGSAHANASPPTSIAHESPATLMTPANSAAEAPSPAPAAPAVVSVAAAPVHKATAQPIAPQTPVPGILDTPTSVRPPKAAPRPKPHASPIERRAPF